ncbi:MAG: Hsp20/alpha crystallin family protein [Alphaproteobacteria bacterium]|jgi:HSP20 family protein
MSETQGMTKADKQAAQAVGPRPESLWQPFNALRGEVERLFDGFWKGMSTGTMKTFGQTDPQGYLPLGGGFGRAVPAIDLVEAEKEFSIKAELPGMDAKDMELILSGDTLTIRGEKKAEHEERKDNYHVSERRFGGFSRSFLLPRGVDREKIAAKFEKGVLTVTLPKTAEAAAQQRKIDINQET